MKSIDKDSKTVVVKTADGMEHTIKYTDQTAVKGARESGKGAKVGTKKATVNYTEKAGEKTSVGVKDASKATTKAVTQ
ncbi:hypothetical protein [Tunturiibacter gelidiferens]|uniref:hypothetical protein n=1 Tax=Tunturiibacter gelidiferens TaxID=3069689 RepID=UPI003D9B02A3